MKRCQCSYQDASCYRGKKLLAQVSRLYYRLQDPYYAKVVLSVRDEWWREYEQARDAYVIHVEGNTVEESEVVRWR